MLSRFSLTPRTGRDIRPGLGATAAFLFLLGVCVAAYWRGLYGPLLLDDYPQLLPMLDPTRFSMIGWSGFLFSQSGPLGRPVAMGTFLFNAMTSGGDLFAWKYTNLLLHLEAGLLAFWLSAELWSFRERSPSGRSWWAAAAIAGAWLLHPLQLSTVLYTVQRMAELSALFVFAGLVCYVRGRKRQVAGDRGGLLIAACFMVFLPLAALSKENGVLLVPLAFAVEIFLFRFSGPSGARNGLWVWFALFLVVPAILVSVVLALRFHSLVLAGYAGRSFTLDQRLLTECRVLIYYLSLLLVPEQRRMGFFHDDFGVSHGWLAPPTTLISFVVILAMLGLAWVARRRFPLVALGIAFFFVGQVLESTILPLELVFEHRNYLPSFGFFLAAAALLAQARLRTATCAALCTSALVILTVLTGLRAETWTSQRSLYAYALRAHPHSERVLSQAAEELTVERQYAAALRLLAPLAGNGPALQRLYVLCMRDGGLSRAQIAKVAQSLSSPLSDYGASGLLEVGALGLDKKCDVPTRPFSGLLSTALSSNVRDRSAAHKLWVYQAQYLWRDGRHRAAFVALENAHQMTPGDPMPLFIATQWSISENKMDRAQAYYTRALATARGSGFAYRRFVSELAASLAGGHGRLPTKP